jgi:hypothetical protein
MFEIKIHKDAELEIFNASQYYEKGKSGLGDEFLDELEDAISKMKKFPLAWPIYN